MPLLSWRRIEAAVFSAIFSQLPKNLAQGAVLSVIFGGFGLALLFDVRFMLAAGNAGDTVMPSAFFWRDG